MTDFNIVISCDDSLELSTNFYEALKNDNINKDDIIFENCKKIIMYDIDGFTKISDYGVFGEGIKDFDCYYCSNLTNLDGAPEEVGGNFYCMYCDNLTNLDGAPKKVGGRFVCNNCDNLTSLKGAPQKVGGDFDCQGCKNITNLDSAPEIVGGYFCCAHCNMLTNLQGAPKEVGCEFRCTFCNPDFIQQAKEKYGSKVKS